jgi:TatD DNase family protein
MILIDTHAHLYAEEFDSDRDEMIARATQKGLANILLPNIDLQSIEPMHQLCAQYPQLLFPMMGLHPSSVGDDYQIVLSKMKMLLSSNNYIAIGEVGIDLYWDKNFIAQQKEAFAMQIQWSIEQELPLVIHSREAHDEIMEVLNSFKTEKLRGVFHCFTGTTEQALEIIDRGFLLGIGGVLTFKNAQLPYTLQAIDLKYLVLETDAPYLSPVPNRGRRNESAYLELVAERLAEIKQLSLTELAEITTRNATNLFNL